MKTIRYGILGCGEHALQSHAIPGRKVRGLELVAVSDPSAEAVQRFNTALRVELPSMSEVDLLEDHSINAVLIASPDRFHTRSLAAAVRAGKHVLCEKPMATTAEEYETLRRALLLADDKSLVVTSCHPRRFDPPYLYVRQELPKLIKRFGAVLSVHLDFSYHKPSKCGLHHGLLIDHINHELDAVNFLLGYSRTWVRRVWDAQDRYEAFGQRQDAVVLHFSGTRMLEERIYPEFITIRFERGHFTLNTKTGHTTVSDHDGEIFIVNGTDAKTDYSRRFLSVMQNFVDAICGGVNYLTEMDLMENSDVGITLSHGPLWDPHHCCS